MRYVLRYITGVKRDDDRALRPIWSIKRWDPFRNISDIQGEVNRLFDSFSGRPHGRRDQLGRSYRDGVLEVKRPRVDEVKPKAIKVDIV